MNNFALILMLAGFPALSTDMYLPAIPTLCEIWGIPLAQANLSLVAFFICFSTFLLVHGPLSDRYGRRPVLLGGVTVYMIGCLLCAASSSIGMLIASRMIQAVGAAAASALSLALTKDLYEGVARKKLMAYLGVIIPLCTMASPTLGAFILSWMSWRAIFVLQGILASCALYGAFRLREPAITASAPGESGLAAAMRRYATLVRNKPYMAYTVCFSLPACAFFAFIAASSHIYIAEFGLSEQAYGYFFALNALSLMAGSLLCSRLCVGIDSRPVLLTAVVGMVVSGVIMLAMGGDTPLRFALPMCGFTFFMGMSRPLSNHIILEQVNKDTGTAASLLTFFFFLCGAVAMETVSLEWPSKPMVIAAMAAGGAVVPLGLLLAQRQPERKSRRKSRQQQNTQDRK